MEKIILIIGFFTLALHAQEGKIENAALQHNCLACHQTQQVPDSLVYKRYLMKYSTNGRMEKAMLKYLKDPKEEYSIMPAPFFLKFPMKKKIEWGESALRSHIQAYLEKYDLKKKLVLEK